MYSMPSVKQIMILAAALPGIADMNQPDGSKYDDNELLSLKYRYIPVNYQHQRINGPSGVLPWGRVNHRIKRSLPLGGRLFRRPGHD